jgi:hypothetical protein
MRTTLPWTASLILLCACSTPSPRLNAPPHGGTDCPSDMQAMYMHMSDNALLEDMNLSEADFVPHRPMLSALGEDRLCRMAALLQQYGGEIHYTPENDDKDLIDRRIETVVDFLAEAGLAAAPQEVSVGLPGGRGMQAREAIVIMVTEGLYQPKQSGGPGLLLAPPPGK